MNKNKSKFILYNIVLPLLILVVLILTISFAAFYITGFGYRTIVFAVVLVFSILIGLAHIGLYFARRHYAGKKGKKYRKKKRRLERIRNIVNYLTPFILLAMLYHFWQMGWGFVSVVVVVVLIDRLNELIRLNK